MRAHRRLALVVSVAATAFASMASAAPGAPDASAEGARPWLAQRTPASVATGTSPEAGPWRSVAALLVLIGVAGAAWYAKKRRKQGAALPPEATAIRIISSARLGPKAQAVVAEVAGRALLLGVTDTNVTPLGWLASHVAEGVDADGSGGASPTDESAPRTLDSGPTGGHPTGAAFSRVLDRALGDEGEEAFRGNPNVAALIASGTEDQLRTTVRRSRGRRPAAPARGGTSATSLEDQVAGLLTKRRRTG